ncbi:phage major capsid protein [Hansschlegelia plantiphila]|uniref:Phage capsid protein n=1 Tax=Hansschlegelia plantiphila TaxID=374655 RepID=A0A9W6J1P0_9HYPH|nr:phage major capsid protein [Hansschlegelia plantiphila]GLK68103.1 phage capsid protein [Hansschlegelia plantiphila]
MNAIIHPRLFNDGPIEFGRKDGGQHSAGGAADDNLELKSVIEAIGKRDREMVDFAKKADAEIKATGQMATETKSALEKLATDASGQQARLMELEQKLARRGGAQGAEALPSLGEQLSGSDDFKALQLRGKGRAVLKVKAVTSVTSTTAGTGGVGAAVQRTRLPGVIAPPDRPMTIRDLLMPGRTDSNAVEYVRETGFQNMTAPVAEGDLKPQSDLSFDLQTTPVRTLAHWVLASKQVLSDIPQLQSYVDQRLRYGLTYVEEMQLLAGNGAGQNLNGLIPQATAYGFAAYSKAADTKIDRLRRAMLQMRIAEYRASAIVMNPIDWTDIVLTKDSIGQYVWSDPTVNNGQNLWGLPVVDTNAMATGKFLVGAFNMAAQIFDREDASVEVSTEDSDNFRRNMVTILGEERLALAVFRPQSFVYGNLVDGNAS